jgi:hypothetical protein
MDDMLQAALLFWLPLALIPVGLWISQSKKSTESSRKGKIILIIGLVLVLASPWTVPESPSSDLGHLFGFIIGPSILVLFGLYMVAYSGNVPVGRLSSGDKYLGFLFFVIGMVWFSFMHWGDLTPVLDSGEINRFWLIFFPNFLISLSCLSLSAGIAMLVLGDNRTAESKNLFFMSGLTLIFIISAMNIDSSETTSNEFRKYVWLSIADLVGILLGSVLAIISFALVIYSYEKSLPKPESILPPTENELQHSAKIISLNLGGDE